MLSHRLLPYGDNGWLVEFEDSAAAVTAGAMFAGPRPQGVTDIVAGMRTQTVCFNHKLVRPREIAAWIESRLASELDELSAQQGPLVEFSVRYDGQDLESLAVALGLEVDELIERHSDCEWTVAFMGFSPGFGYLTSPGWNFEVPRLATPRTDVPAGAVALAAGFSGVYPRNSPGGWQLIGSTDAELWNTQRVPAALLAPGTRLRFVRG